MFVIGKILKPHGVKGEIRLFLTTDDPSRFSGLRSVGVKFDDNRENLCLDIERVRPARQFILIKFKGIDTINAAEGIRGGAITITDDQALPLQADEYYVRDLYDMRVITEAGEPLGIIADVLETGANDVYVVRRANGGDILIPAVKEYIISVDTEARIMRVLLAEGML